MQRSIVAVCLSGPLPVAPFLRDGLAAGYVAQRRGGCLVPEIRAATGTREALWQAVFMAQPKHRREFSNDRASASAGGIFPMGSSSRR